MMRHSRRFLPLLVWMLLAACGGAPERPVNPVLEQAYELHTAGRQAFLRGDYRTAQGRFAAAEKLHTSLDDPDGAAINRLDMVRSYQAQSNPVAAERELETLLAADLSRLPAQRAAEAALLKATLSLAAARADDAQRWLETARKTCVSPCTLRGSLLVLDAQLHLRRGQAEEAQRLAGAASEALAALPDAGAEKANALRVAGEAAWLRRDYALASQRIEAALMLDRELGLPTRVALDLRLLGATALAAGEPARARNLYRRALTASQAAHDVHGVLAAEAALRTLAPSPTKEQP